MVPAVDGHRTRAFDKRIGEEIHSAHNRGVHDNGIVHGAIAFYHYIARNRFYIQIDSRTQREKEIA